MAVLIIGLIVFLGVHSVRIVAPGLRRGIVERRGLGAWKGIYSVVALVGFVLIVWGYGLARQAAPPVLYVTPFWMVHVNALLMVFAFIALAASQLPPGRIKVALKHPMLVAVKIWALGHLLVNGDLASLVLFGAFLAWAVADRISEKRRLKAGETAQPVFVTARADAIAVIAGLVLYVLFVWRLHVWLIGVPPFA